MDVEWFRSRKKELRLNDEAVGRAIGRERSVANKLLNGKVPFDNAYVAALAELFKVSRQEVLHRAGVLDAAPESNALPVPMSGPDARKSPINLPVYGTALGAARQIEGEAIEQTTLNSAETIHYIKRPGLVRDSDDAYGIYVQGSSMHPAHPDGGLVVAVAGMPLRIGDDVIVYLRPSDPEDDDGRTARAVLLKRLVKRNSLYVELQQFEPALTFQVPMRDVVRIDRVLTMSELLG